MWLVLAMFLIWPFGALAEGLLGNWQSPPDPKGQIGHVVIHACGSTLCGTLERAYDRAGQRVETPNVGRRLRFDVRAHGNGQYTGRAYVPSFGRDFPAKLELNGDRLVVRGCMADTLCKKQTWARVR